MSIVPSPNVSLTVSSDSPLIAGGVNDGTLTCSASVDRGVIDFGDIVYSFTWYNSEGEVKSSNRTVISYMISTSTLTLSPLSVYDSNVTCCVVGSEGQCRLNPTNTTCLSVTSIVKG